MKKRLGMSILFLFALQALFAGGGAEKKEPAEINPQPRIISCAKGFSLVLNTLYLFPEAREFLVALGISSQAGGSFTEYLDPGFQDKALFTMDVSAEEIASHNPDWVVLKSYLTESLGAQIENLGIKVLYVDLETPEQFSRDIIALGEIMNNPARARELVNYFDAGRKNIISQTDKLIPEKRPEVLFLYYNARGGKVSFNVPPADWLQTILVEWAGGRAVWKGQTVSKGWTEISFEQIAAWNPEYIFLVSYHGNVEEVKASVLADPGWKNLKAVKDGKMLAFPGDYLSWDQPDPRWILGLYWLASTMHPQIMSAAERDSEVREFFNFAWGISETAFEGDILPRITGDYRK